MRAMKNSYRGLPAFLHALETGKIKSRARGLPPKTNNELLEAAKAQSPQWWQEYHKASADGLSAPAIWKFWLTGSVSVLRKTTAKIFDEDLESERRHYRGKRNTARSERQWSEIEVLAWFATKDIQIVSHLRDFGHQKRNLAETARTRGLRYLRILVAIDHCCCGKLQRQPLEIGASMACTCVKSAWDRMVACLEEGLIVGRVYNEDGSYRTVPPDEFLMAEWNQRAGTIELLKDPRELLFKQSDVQSFTATTNGGQLSERRHNTTTPELAERGKKTNGGRPPGAGAIDDEVHLDGMRQWLLENPKKSVWDAAKEFEKAANNGRATPDSVIRRLSRKYRTRWPKEINVSIHSIHLSS